MTLQREDKRGFQQAHIICLNPGVVDSNRLAMIVNSRASQEGDIFLEFPNINSDGLLREILFFLCGNILKFDLLLKPTVKDLMLSDARN